jgi:hypothetical protein
MTGSKRSVLAGLVLALSATAAAADSSPTLIGTSKDWSAFQTTAGNTRVCYAVGHPKTMEPKKAARDPVSFIIGDWPGRKSKGELQIVPGYQYKEGSDVTAQVGTEKVTFFTRNEDGAGSAWVEDDGQEKKLIDAMTRGAKLVVTGTSQRGTVTHDTYSLGGISEALQKVHEACGM